MFPTSIPFGNLPNSWQVLDIRSIENHDLKILIFASGETLACSKDTLKRLEHDEEW